MTVQNTINLLNAVVGGCGRTSSDILVSEKYSDIVELPLCGECEIIGLCSTCAELWESEIDLEDMEAEEEF